MSSSDRHLFIIPIPILQLGDYLHEENPVYEDIDKFNELKKFMEEKLEDYNMEPGIIGMDLVLFKDAIEHGMEVWMDGWMDGWINGWMDP